MVNLTKRPPEQCSRAGDTVPYRSTEWSSRAGLDRRASRARVMFAGPRSSHRVSVVR